MIGIGWAINFIGCPLFGIGRPMIEIGWAMNFIGRPLIGIGCLMNSRIPPGTGENPAPGGQRLLL